MIHHHNTASQNQKWQTPGFLLTPLQPNTYYNEKLERSPGNIQYFLPCTKCEFYNCKATIYKDPCNTHRTHESRFHDHFGFSIFLKKKLLIILKHVTFTPTWAILEKLIRHTINTGLNLFGRLTKRKKDSNHCHKHTTYLVVDTWHIKYKIQEPHTSSVHNSILYLVMKEHCEN